MFKLVISDDEGKTTVVPLIREEITIGRKEGNTIRLTDRNVSRFHARVIRQGEDFVIEDLGSLCGTNVNNTVLRSGTHIIATGDNISIGDYSLSIRSDVGSEVPMGKQMEPGDQAGIGKVTSNARLVMLSEPEPGKEVELTAELYVIGRSEEANFKIEHPSISRAHARIDLESGKWTISDLDSSNGIEINGHKKDDYVLKAGDRIILGSVELRYVAPGEPFDFSPPEQQVQTDDRLSIEPTPEKKSKRMLYSLIGIAIFAVALILVGVTVLDPSENGLSGDASGDDNIETFESLLETGKDKMQQEEWAEAARLFALAHQKNPDNDVAREMKSLAIKESDAQTAFKAGLAAQENQNWQDAIANFSQIPRSSHYYDAEQIKIVAGKLCDELLEKASFIDKTGSRFDLEKVIDEIFNIKEAPRRCRGPKDRLLARIRQRAITGVAKEDLKSKSASGKSASTESPKKSRSRSSSRSRSRSERSSRKKSKPASSVQSKVEWGGSSQSSAPKSPHADNPYD